MNRDLNTELLVRSVDPAWTVNDLLRHIPESAATLSRLGIDMCCGGSLPIAEAAAAVGTTLEAIAADLAGEDVPAAADACSVRR
jgi:regulator of cell morphogenesis and NO signaling